MSALPRAISSVKPFENFYQKYRDKGWLGTLPLPEKKKAKPPEGFTGYRPDSKLEPEDVDIQRWLKERRWNKGNICLRLGPTVTVDGAEYEVMALDVDHYDDKRGGDSLKDLETQYGTLPPTWISTSRIDGTSGIRFYLVPTGLAFKDKPGPCIETIQRRHRYAVVYPSWHPNGGQYFWYAPGCAPDGIHISDDLPSVFELPKLPDTWVDYITNGRVHDSAGEIDVTTDEVTLGKWLQDNLADGAGMCRLIEKRCAARLQECNDTTAHHDLMRSAHWEFVKLGVEGHTGWFEALKQFNTAWRVSVVQAGKRPLYIAQTETRGSFLGAVRKAKGEIDAGNLVVSKGHKCVGASPPGTIFGFGVPPSPGAGDPDTYLRNDNGNARHFLALYGTNLRYVGNHPEGGGKWIVFNENTKRWVVDRKDVVTRTLFREVEKRQIAFGQDLQEIARLRNRNSVIPANLQTLAARFDPQRVPADELDKLGGGWIKWGTDSGNKARVTNSLTQAMYYDEVALDFERLDNDPYLLPVANGLIRFATKAERDAGKAPFEWIEDVALCKEYLVTQNTNVPYIPLSEQESHEDPAVRESYRKFNDYLALFMKSHLGQDSWEYARKALGYTILGINSKKAIFLYGDTDTGKSTLQNMMEAALGDLAIACEPRVFLDTPFKGSLAEALPRRAMMVGEIGGKQVDAELFKNVTGGNSISCQLKNINTPVKMPARCTVISSCNSAPDIPDADTATINRFIVIPFRHQVKGNEKDTTAIDALPIACKVTVLAWLIENCCDAIVSDMEDVPAELAMEVKAFSDELSDFSDFINDCIVKCSDAEWKKYSTGFDPKDPKPPWPDELCETLNEVYGCYKRYALSHGMEVLSQSKVTRRLKKAGFVQDPSKTNSKERRWVGIKLKENSRVRSV